MKTFIDPGELRARVDHQTCTLVPDGQGGQAEVWTSQGKYWAAIRHRSFAAIERAKGEEFDQRFDAILRAGPLIESGDRIVEGARKFIVQVVFDPDETGRYLTCQCTLEDAQ